MLGCLQRRKLAAESEPTNSNAPARQQRGTEPSGTGARFALSAAILRGDPDRCVPLIHRGL